MEVELLENLISIYGYLLIVTLLGFILYFTVKNIKISKKLQKKYNEKNINIAYVHTIIIDNSKIIKDTPLLVKEKIRKEINYGKDKRKKEI